MADRPNQNPPAPLNAEEADRLAEQFTPLWESDEAPRGATTQPMPAVPEPANAAPTANAAANANAVPSAAMPGPAASPTAALPVGKASAGKHTLLGLAPTTAGSTPAAAPPAATAPGPSAIPMNAQGIPVNPHLQQPSGPPKQTLLGLAPLPDAFPEVRKPEVVAPPAVHQPPVELGRAYTPKDDPLTPAVVLAEDVRVESTPKAQPSAKQALAMTVPSMQRVELPTKPEVDVASDDEEVEYPGRKGGKTLVLALLGATLLGLVVIGISSLSGKSETTEVAPTTTTAKAPEAAPAAPTAEEPSEPAQPESEPAAKEVKGKATPSRTADETNKVARPKRSQPAREPVKAVRRPGATSATKAAAARGGESQSAPQKSKGGVIVRDTPF